MASLASDPQSAERNDELMTAEREEIKYLVPRERVGFVQSVVSRHLSSHRFSGEGANSLPDPHHFVTTIYFDTPSRLHFRGALANVAANVKVRAKEYYDLHPCLAELATDPAQIVRYQPWLWFEIKRRTGSSTEKRRFRLLKRDVPRILRAEALSAEALRDESERDHARAGFTDLAEYVQAIGEPLCADTLVNYQRVPFQDEAGTLRVTLDFGLAFYAPPSDLWLREQALVRNSLGGELGKLGGAVLEIKRRGPLPTWLSGLLETCELSPVSFSKFVAGAHAVHGPA